MNNWRSPPSDEMEPLQSGFGNVKEALIYIIQGLKHFWLPFFEPRDMGEFMLPGLRISNLMAHMLLWIVFFTVAFLFEASKLYLAIVQRDANRRKHRNPCMKKIQILMKIHLTMTALIHNIVGYLLMMAVMVFMHLLVPVILGMMLGYFLLGIFKIRIHMQCFCGCIPECLPKCDEAGGDRCRRALCDTQECEEHLMGKLEQIEQQQSGTKACTNHLINEIELRQTNLQSELFHYEGQNNRSSHLHSGSRKSLELFSCTHESLPKLPSKHENVLMPSPPSLPTFSSNANLYESHPEYYFTCDQGHLHHYPQFCPHLLKNKITI